MRSVQYYGTSHSKRMEVPTYAQFCILVWAVGFISGGIICFYFSTFHTREHSVALFEQASQEWEETYRPQFEMANFSIFSSLNHTSFNDEKQISLYPTEFEQFSRGFSSEYVDADLLKYEPLKYQTSGILPLDFLPEADFDEPNSVSLKILAQHYLSEADSTVLSEVELDEVVPLTRKVQHYAPNPAPEQKCPVQLNGIYNRRTRRCDVYEKIHSICVQVQLDSQKQWKISQEENGNYGCDPHDMWEPFHYLPVKVKRVSTSAAPNFQADVMFPRDNLTDVTLIVRHYADPYLLAEVLTNNTMDFGLATSDWQLIGGFLVLIGVLASIQPALRYRKEFRNNRLLLESPQSSFHDLENIDEDDYRFVSGHSSGSEISERGSPPTVHVDEFEDPNLFAPVLSPVLEHHDSDKDEKEELSPLYSSYRQNKDDISLEDMEVEMSDLATNNVFSKDENIFSAKKKAVEWQPII